MYRTIFFFLLFCILLLSACKNNIIYQSEQNLPENGWTRTDSLNFKYNISDTAARYDLLVDFKFKTDYAYQNVYVQLFTLFPDGTRLSKVLPFNFFKINGAPNGECSGNDCKMRFNLQNNAFYNAPGDYTLTLKQFMRQDTIAGIESIGFAIEKK